MVLFCKKGLLAFAVAFATPTRAGTITARAGEHADYSRIVFTVPPQITCRTARVGDLLILTCPNGGDIPGLAVAPTHTLSVSGGKDEAAIGLAPSMQVHVWRIDRRVIIDIFAAPTSSSR